MLALFSDASSQGASGGAFQPLSPLRHIERHFGIVGRIAFQRRLHGRARLFRVQVGGRRSESLAVE